MNTLIIKSLIALALFSMTACASYSQQHSGYYPYRSSYSVERSYYAQPRSEIRLYNATPFYPIPYRHHHDHGFGFNGHYHESHHGQFFGRPPHHGHHRNHRD